MSVCVCVCVCVFSFSPTVSLRALLSKQVNLDHTIITID